MAATENQAYQTDKEEDEKIYVVNNHVLDNSVHQTLEHNALNAVDSSVHQALEAGTFEVTSPDTINVETLLPSTSHESNVTEIASTATGPCNSPRSSMRRQVTFAIGVQTEISQTNSVFNPLSPGDTPIGSPREAPVASEEIANEANGAAVVTTRYGTESFVSVANNETNGSRYRRFVQSLDCTTFCYMAIAGLMISVGILVTAVTAREKVTSDDSNGSAQLWIVGPIFISSGILVCIKAATHVCKRLNQTTSAQEGNFLRPDSRASLNQVPPSYSKALVAPVPSCVVEVDDAWDDKFPEVQQQQHEVVTDPDAESHRLVTIVCEPPPPSYGEALETIRRYSLSEHKRSNINRRDVATQIGSEPVQTSGNSNDRRVRNAFSANDVSQNTPSRPQADV